MVMFVASKEASNLFHLKAKAGRKPLRVSGWFVLASVASISPSEILAESHFTRCVIKLSG